MDFLNTLVLVGAIQGVLSGAILFRSKKGNAFKLLEKAVDTKPR